jgi:hypothetical protein
MFHIDKNQSETKQTSSIKQVSKFLQDTEKKIEYWFVRIIRKEKQDLNLKISFH